MKRLLASVSALALSIAPAAAQTVLQGGTWTGRHVPIYSPASGYGQAVIQDSGPAGGATSTFPGASEGLYVAPPPSGGGSPPYASTGTGPLGTNWCDYDGPITGPYHYFCMSPNASGGSLMAIGYGGGASPLSLYVSINGTKYPFPFVLSGSGVIGPATTVVGDFVCWGNTTGTLVNDCGSTISVAQGGTGNVSFTAGLPLIGSGAGALAQGTISGNTSQFATVNGALTPGHSVVVDANGNLENSSSTGGTVNIGTQGQSAFYDTTTALSASTGPCNILAFGADPTGTNDSTSAINTGWTTGCAMLYAPAGTYKFSANLVPPSSNGAGLIGDGHDRTIFTTSGPYGITPASHLTGLQFRGFSLESSITTSGDGLNMSASASRAVVRDLFISGYNIALYLANTDFSEVEDVEINACGSYGVFLDGSANGGVSALQWQMTNVSVNNCTGTGFFAYGLGSTSVGQWARLASYNNGGYGIAMNGLAQIRLSDSFFGTDRLSEVFIGQSSGTSGYAHLLTNVATELSQTGYGFDINSSNAAPVSIVNGSAVGNYLSGAFSYNQSNTSIVGGGYRSNGEGNQSGNTYGILGFGTGNITVTGVQALAGGTQTFGILENSSMTNAANLGNHVGTGGLSCVAASCGNYANY